MVMPLDAAESVAQAEEYLRIHRPVRRRHGKILEEGASGFLGKKFVMNKNTVAVNDGINENWDSFSKMCSDGSSLEDVTFGSKHWTSVYLAGNPQQAAELGLKFPGVDEVEEIDDVDDNSSDPFIADAVANERDLNLIEEQKRNFRKEAVQRELCSADELKEFQLDGTTAHGSNPENDYRPSTDYDGSNPKNDYKLVGEVTDFIESRGFKRSGECGELQSDHKKCCTLAMNSDSEAPSALNKISPMKEVTSLCFSLLLRLTNLNKPGSVFDTLMLESALTFHIC